MLLSGSQEVVIIEDLVERVLLPVVVPNHKLLAEHVHSFVHQSYLFWLDELSLWSTLVHRFLMLQLFSHPGCLLKAGPGGLKLVIAHLALLALLMSLLLLLPWMQGVLGQLRRLAGHGRGLKFVQIRLVSC